MMTPITLDQLDTLFNTWVETNKEAITESEMLILENAQEVIGMVQSRIDEDAVMRQEKRDAIKSDLIEDEARWERDQLGGEIIE